MTVDRLTVADRVYELRYNLCGRANCRTCYPPEGDIRDQPGHGPYWYLYATSRGITRRIYIGRDLDTRKYITPDGRIDWEAIKLKRLKKAHKTLSGPGAKRSYQGDD